MIRVPGEWLVVQPHTKSRASMWTIRPPAWVPDTGLSAREIADHLGHEKVSVTQDVYMSGRVPGVAAAVALDGFG